MRRAAPRVTINNVVLGLKYDEASYDVALRHSNVLSVKWERTECPAADGSRDPPKTREEVRLTDEELRVDRFIARHVKSHTKSLV